MPFNLIIPSSVAMATIVDDLMVLSPLAMATSFEVRIQKTECLPLLNREDLNV